MSFKYVSLDIETTGLDPENCQILEFGAIIEDTTKKLPFDQIPKFKKIIYHEEIRGSAFALNMNNRIISIIANYKSMCDNFSNKKISEDEIKNYIKNNNITTLKNLALEFYQFLEPHFTTGANIGIQKININVAGKNFGMFDYGFIKRIPEIENVIGFSSRILDPAILCVDWASDSRLPNLTECKQRCGISGEVTHDALEDAWDVIQVLRKFY